MLEERTVPAASISALADAYEGGAAKIKAWNHNGNIPQGRRYVAIHAQMGINAQFPGNLSPDDYGFTWQPSPQNRVRIGVTKS